MLRKFIYATALTILLASCSISEAEVNEPNNQNEISAQTESSATSEDITTDKETIDAPVNRTTEIVNPPWQQYSSSKITELVDSGETVFLFSDAELLEEHILNESQRYFDDDELKKKSISTFANMIDLFTEETSKFYPEKEGYYNKLQEIKTKLTSEIYDDVPSLIEEASVLRESD